MTTYTLHARVRMHEAGVEEEWVERTLRSPERLTPDPGFSHRTRAYIRIEERGNRWLRVVYEGSRADPLVVTAFFDRHGGR